ncbi:MAG: SpoIIE family protein phosphatase [Planctomycetes bacterium]|nr:SpoIIE family protein phosphatase [Planctomycetota bacterium]
MDSTQPIHVLLIEDASFIHKAVKSILGREHHYSYHTDWARSLSDGISMAANNSYDVVLSALELPDSESAHTIDQLCSELKNLPIIVLTGSDDEQLAVQALRRGAQDYLSKNTVGDGNSLPRSIQYAIERKKHELENQRLIHELRETKEQLESINARHNHDLIAATHVQHSLLPNDFIDPDKIHCEWFYRPCDELAGDLVNTFQLANRFLAFYVLDVSGHGLASAFLSMQVHQAITQNNFQNLLFEQEHIRPPHEVLALLNKEFQMRKPMLLYFTILYGIIDMDNGKITYSSAGHPAPFIHKYAGHVVIPEALGMPIGLMPDSNYNDEHLTVEDGDRIFIFSDGIYETVNVQDEEFGRKRLMDCIKNNHSKNLKDCLQAINDDVDAWMYPSSSQDDRSIISFEFIDEASATNTIG